MFSPLNYKFLIAELKDAYKNDNLFWLSKEYNRFRCRQIQQYWHKKYKETNDKKYLNGEKFLKYLLKMSKNRKNWEKYLQEKTALEN